jgi:hypothetical protein
MTVVPGSVVTLRLVHGPWVAGAAVDKDGLADAVEIALAVERREASGLATGDDHRRYRLAVAAIARHARRRGEVLGTCTLGQAMTIVEAAAGAEGRLSRTFHPPAVLSEHVEALRRLGGEAEPFLRAAQHAAAQSAGYVVTVDAGALVGPEPPRAGRDTAQRLAPQRELADALRSAPEPSEADDGRRSGALRLRAEAASALEAGEPLPVGAGARHDALAELLRTLCRPEAPAGHLRVLYVDGSEPAPIALHPLPSRPRVPGEFVRLGLMSMRHTKLDGDVDGYWFRNRMVSLNRTLAETDASCAEQSEAMLEQLTGAGITDIGLVHTGFEPAALGFYRALASWLVDAQRPAIRVTPFYKRGPQYLPGTPWGGE